MLILCRLISAENKWQLLMNVGQLEQHLLAKRVETAIPPNSIVELGKILGKIQINSFLSINKVIFIEY